MQQKPFSKLLSIALALCLMLGMIPMAAFAEEDLGGNATPSDSSPADTIIAELDELPEQILYQGYDVGEIKSREEITLPETLAGTDEDENAITIEGVTWGSKPVFDHEAAGVYEFSPVLPKGYALADSVSAPVISVVLRPEGGVGIMPMAGTPTVSGMRFYANGTPVIIKENGNIVSAYADDGITLLSGSNDLSSLVIYGGWESGNQTGNTSLTILSGTFNSTVYGGSREGNITGNTNLRIEGGTFTSHAYGGSALAGADVSGCANVTVENAIFTNSSLWGAGFGDNTVGSTNVVIKGGSFLWVYGGGNESSVEGTAKLTITGGDFSKTIFGGSDSASATVKNTDVTVANVDIPFLYGGGWCAPVTDTAKLTIESGNFGVSVHDGGAVWGGGSQPSATVGNTLLTIKGGTFPPYCTIFGGGSSATVTGTVQLNIEGGTFHPIYSGGALDGSAVGNTMVNIKGGTFNHEVFGGGMQSNVIHDVSMTIEGGTFHSGITGSGNGYTDNGSVGGNVEIHLKGGNLLRNTAPTAATNSSRVAGNATIFVYPGAVFDSLATIRSEDSHVGGHSAIKYSIGIQTAGNGTASASSEFGEKDEQITLNVTANGGYKFKEWNISPAVSFTNGTSKTDSIAVFIMPAEPVTVTAVYESTGSGNKENNGTGSGSSSGSGSSNRDSDLTGPSRPAGIPADITKAQAAGAAEKAGAEAKANGAASATVRFKNPAGISLQILQAMRAAAGMPVALWADSMSENGKTVNVRISLNPAQSAKGLNLSASLQNKRTKAVKAFFEKWFQNKLQVVSLGEQGSFGQAVEIIAKVDLTGMDAENLVFYSYGKKANKYTRIDSPACWIDSNGYLHFTTELAGDIVISDGAFVKK